LHGRKLPVKCACGSETSTQRVFEIGGQGHFVGVRAVLHYSLEIGNLNRSGFEKVKKSEEPVKMSVQQLILGHVQQDGKTSLQVILADDAVKVLVEALEGLLKGESLGEHPLLDLVNHLLFPVEVDLDASAN